MEILEVIELRTAPGNSEIIEKYLRDWIRESLNKVHIANSYRHYRLETDFCVHIRYDIGKEKSIPITMGKQLARSLKNFGLVNYSVWVEQEFKT